MYCTRFELLMGLQRGYSIITLAPGEAGLYMRNYRNGFGTSLAARGPVGHIQFLVADTLRNVTAATNPENRKQTCTS